MEGDAITQTAGAQIYIGKKIAQSKGIEELKQVLVHQTKDHCGQQNGSLFAVDPYPVNDLFAADVLLQQGSQDDHKENLQWVIVHGVIHNSVLCGTAGENHGQKRTQQITTIHQAKSHRQQNQEFPGTQIVLFRCLRGKLSQDQQTCRDRNQVDGEKSAQPETGARLCEPVIFSQKEGWQMQPQQL